MDTEIQKEFKSAISDISTDIIVQVAETGLDLLTNAPQLIEAIPISRQPSQSRQGRNRYT